MTIPRISASSYSNTAPLIWSFLYGSQKGSAEVILDNAPSRSAKLLQEDRVDCALVPVIAFQEIAGLRMVPDVCVGSEKRVRSVCLVTNGRGLKDVGSVALDVSSRTSVALTKVIFREFLNHEPDWIDADPNVAEMLKEADCALLIGDPALRISASENNELRVFDLAELWNELTGLGFVFAMWMGRAEPRGISFQEARDEGLSHLEEIIANYSDSITLTGNEFKEYLTSNISYRVSEAMDEGLRLYFRLCEKHGLLKAMREIDYF